MAVPYHSRQDNSCIAFIRSEKPLIDSCDSLLSRKQACQLSSMWFPLIVNESKSSLSEAGQENHNERDNCFTAAHSLLFCICHTFLVQHCQNYHMKYKLLTEEEWSYFGFSYKIPRLRRNKFGLCWKGMNFQAFLVRILK